MRILALVLFTFGLAVSPAQAEWQPKGPINFWIGFGAGGGTDTQARSLAEELEAKFGWRVIPSNKAGGGGAVMAAALKDAPTDGQTVGLAINTTFDFATLTNDSLSIEDFTYITTTAGSQTGVLARADSGWQTLEDVAKAAKSGTRIVWSNWGDQVQAGAEIIARHYGFPVNHLRMKGGKATMNALVAQDANVAWGGGVQRGLVAAGELVILASAEREPLVQAPDKPTLEALGIPYTFGFQFLLAGPRGMSLEARDAIATAIGQVLLDPDSKTRAFIAKQYPPGPVLLAGDALEVQLKANLEANRKLLEAVKQ